MGCSCGQSCGPCSLQASALRGDPLARKLLGDAPTMGDLFPVFVTPGVVRAQKEKLDPSFISTDADVRACASLSDPERAAWAAFFKSWQTYRASEETFWGVKSEYDTGLFFAESLSRWQKQLEGRCKLAAPRVVTDAELTDLSPIKWAAVAVIAVAVVYGVHTVLK